MRALLTIGLLCVLAIAQAAPALAFTDPRVDEVVKRVKKSIIRVQSIGISDPMPSASQGGGSGVVFQINYDKGTAYALTNHHVSGHGMVNSVRFWDGAEYRADTVATEPGIDTALIELYGIPDERNLPDSEKTIVAAILGDSDKTQIGEYGIAMGAPGAGDGINSDRDDPWQNFLLQQTSTFGVVSGKEGDPMVFGGFWSGWRNAQGHQVMTNVPWTFKVAVAINGGNSGGPLFNGRGEVIGLNHAGRGNVGELWQNHNFSIPINLSKNFAYQILNTGKYELPWLGMDVIVPRRYYDVDDWANRVYDPEVARLFGVRKDSPAERAGLKEHDVIVEFDGQTFPTVKDLRQYIFKLPIGRQVPIVVNRGGKKVHLTAEIGPKRGYDSELSL